MIRVGAGVKGQKQGGEEMRVRPDGKPLPAYSAENKTVEPIEDTRFSRTRPDSVETVLNRVHITGH